MFDLQRLRAFRAVVASGSVQAAAAALGYTSSAVSQQISALQRETGLVLFEKAGRGIVPTPAAELLVAESDELMTQVAHVHGVVQDLSSGRSGTLTVRAFPSAGEGWLPEIKTSGGKYVAPQKVEGALVAASPYASQVVVSGEGRKYIVALIALDPESITGWASGQGLDTSDYATMINSQPVQDLLQSHVDKANTQLERHETIKRFAVLPGELSIGEGEVTPSMKIRRAKIAERYDSLVDSLYDED